ncbi:MAG: hypothetical protein KGJ13_05765 [Patescibacteria group bacterium]|nr:hypothetical protein [Patescibacteria group bacterium]
MPENTPLVPDPQPHVPHAPVRDIPLSTIVESAEAFISPKSGEAEAEAAFEKNLEQAAEKANPGNEMLNAMNDGHDSR